MIINCSNIKYSAGANEILTDISFGVESGVKAGIIGANGAGKTTLFRIITGEITPDSGSVSIARNAEAGLLRQDPALNENDTVYASVISVFNNLKLLEFRISEAEQKISEYDNAGLDNLQKLLDSHAKLIAEYTDKGGYEYQSKTNAVLELLGFPPETWEQKISGMSGGQKTRIGLIKLFLREPDILLLDEPTNHVDVSSLEWLENYIKNYRKTVLIISHDRYFLDNVVTQIIEIENKKSYVYSGNYTEFVNKKAEDREIRQKQFDIQQREIKRIEEMIARLRAWGGIKKIKQAKSKEKMLDKIERADRPGKLPDTVRLDFGDDKNERFRESGEDVLSVTELAKSFPPKKLFEELSFEVKKRDRFFIIGANGTGKSTLLKILTGRVSPDGGRFSFGYNIRMGYYDQENQNLDPENTVLDELWDDYGDMNYGEVRNILAAFLFRQDDIEKTVRVLSGGEKSRLTIAKLILKKSNVLILDEPTNHLDINSREALEAALLNFKGTLIAVSHDRYFINKLATRIFEISPELDGGYIDYKDGYTEYTEYKRSFLLNPGTGSDKSGKDKFEKIDKKDKKDKIDIEKEREKQALEDARKLKKRREQIEKEKRAAELEIKRVEKRMAELDYMIKDDEVEADYVKLNEIYEEKDILEEKLEKLYEKFYREI